jgi:hypothetical protein
LITPSTRPSSESQASEVALEMSGTFAACSQSPNCGTSLRTNAWKRPVQLMTGTTLTMPS